MEVSKKFRKSYQACSATLRITLNNSSSCSQSMRIQMKPRKSFTKTSVMPTTIWIPNNRVIRILWLSSRNWLPRWIPRKEKSKSLTHSAKMMKSETTFCNIWKNANQSRILPKLSKWTCLRDQSKPFAPCFNKTSICLRSTPFPRTSPGSLSRSSKIWSLWIKNWPKFLKFPKNLRRFSYT